MTIFERRKDLILSRYQAITTRPNLPVEGNGIYTRFANPVITSDMIPPTWKYDFNPETNPYFEERIGVNSTFNAGAIKWDDKYVLVVRVEGMDRKSYFAVAESPNGIDHFKFWPRPISMPESDEPGTNVYDMRLTKHQDGWVYGLFCVEKHDERFPHDFSAVQTKCGIARTKDLIHWERLPDLKSRVPQRNVVLHPDFVDGKYGLYTRPQNTFNDKGVSDGIGWALVDDMAHAEINHEQIIIDDRMYQTIKEVENGQGPAPIRTKKGWLHLAHGVYSCASGMRYVLYMFMTALDEPWRKIASPGGYFMAPVGDEYIGDVMNVLFSNGWIADTDGRVFIYYASSDTRIHVATSTVDRLVDYCFNTPEDGHSSSESVRTINKLITNNEKFITLD